MTDIQLFEPEQIQELIFTIRETQVMLDRDLAGLYGVETRVLNQAVKRNIERFPETFRFRLTQHEAENLKSQSVTSSSGHGGRRKSPYVFTEQGVAMLSAVLRSDQAVKVSLGIMNAFVAMRKYMSQNALLLQRMERVEHKQLAEKVEIDAKFEQVFDALEQREIAPKQGIIYEGQIFDAHVLVTKIIRSAKESVIIVDNYIDDTVLTLLSKRQKGVQAKIYTKSISRRLKLDLEKFNAQYEPVAVNELKNCHDRFIIIDNRDIYHSGASLKDLGKKISAFSKLDKQALMLLDVINE